MIEVNVLELKNILTSYRDILKRIDSNNEDIIFNFNDLSKNWHDPRSIRLQGSIALEKGRIEKLYDNVKSEYSIYDVVYKEYKKLGNKIKCSLDNKDYVNSKIDNIIKLANTINNQYCNLGDLSFYNRSYIIYNNKKKIGEILKTIKEIKRDINIKYHRIEEIENLVSERISNIEIETFVLNNYERED